MRAILSVVSLLAFCGYVFAADTTTVVPAAPAPEKTVQSAPLKVEKPAAKVEKPAAAASVSWYGMAMLRLREDVSTNYLKNGLTMEGAQYSYQIAYKVGVNAKPNDQTLINLELGNDWYGTETATGIPGNYYLKRESLTPWFSLAYAQWDPGYMHILAGIVPVKGSMMMDLVGASILNNRTYKTAAHTPWGTVTNFGQTGLKLGAPILNGPFSLGIDMTSAIFEHRSVVLATTGMQYNSTAVEFLLDLPMKIAGLSANPQVFITPNRTYSVTKKKGDIEYGAGMDLGYKLNDMASLRAGYAYARNSNAMSWGDSVWKDPFNQTAAGGKMYDKFYDRYGTETGIGTTLKFATGKLDFDFLLSNDVNLSDTTVNDWYPFFDIKYAWAINKNFSITPRVRLFFTELNQNAPTNAYNNQLKTRPEIIITGTF